MRVKYKSLSEILEDHNLKIVYLVGCNQFAVQTGRKFVRVDGRCTFNSVDELLVSMNQTSDLIDLFTIESNQALVTMSLEIKEHSVIPDIDSYYQMAAELLI